MGQTGMSTGWPSACKLMVSPQAKAGSCQADANPGPSNACILRRISAPSALHLGIAIQICQSWKIFYVISYSMRFIFDIKWL
jgi:hypothetical protein